MKLDKLPFSKRRGRMNYNESTEFLLGLPDMERSSHGAKARTMSLETMCALLKRLGHPELGRKTVHVTGSKGKGSTSAFVAAMLSSVAPTSLYTSPSLHSYRERICLDLEPVSEEDFAFGVTAIKDAVLAEHQGPLGPVSTFGGMTSLFFFLSAKHQMRWQVVEVGMGGLYDGTNVFDDKELVIITAISLEHTNVLGKTTLDIAQNKAGIIRPGASVVLAPQSDPAVVELISKICQEKSAHFVDVAREYQVEAEDFDAHEQSFSIVSAQGRRRFKIRMLGRHQLDNACTAIAAADALNARGTAISEAQIENALIEVFLPGRMELLHSAPQVLIDGAHNGESAAALVAGLERHYPAREYCFVLGVNSDKNIKQILESIKPACKQLIATRSANEKAMEPALIVAAAKELQMQCESHESSRKAIERGMELAGEPGLVCATGSLYLVAEVREYFLGQTAPWSLKSPHLLLERKPC